MLIPVNRGVGMVGDGTGLWGTGLFSSGTDATGWNWADWLLIGFLAYSGYTLLVDSKTIAKYIWK